MQKLYKKILKKCTDKQR